MTSPFDDPFFRDDFEEDDIMEGFQSHFDHMERLMSGFFNFPSLASSQFERSRPQLTGSRGGYQSRPSAYSGRSSHGVVVEEVDDEANVAASRSMPVVEEPGAMKPGCYYSSTTTTVTGPDGVKHVQRKVRDGLKGTTHFTDTKELNGRAVTVERYTDEEGKVTEHTSDFDDLATFNREWEARRNHWSHHRYLE